MGVAFSLELAGQVIRVRALFEESRRYCRDYLTDGPPSFQVDITLEDIAAERDKCRRVARLEGREPTVYSDAYLETLAVYRKIAAELLHHDTLLFHGSAVAVDGEVYLFTAKSGTGKSTHAQLWLQHFGPRAVILNDDKPLLRLEKEGVTVYGTPWDGKHRRSANLAFPLKAICILQRGPTNQIQPMDKRTALPTLCQQSFRPADPQALQKALHLIDKLGSLVPLYSLRCNRNPDAAVIAYTGMNPPLP